MKSIITLVMLSLAVLLFSSCARPEPPASKGYLMGNVTIGPLCPVEPCNPSPTVLREAYATRKIVVTSKETGFPKEVLIDSRGYYVTTLTPGWYTIGIAKKGMDRADLPDVVEIRPNETMRVDVHIDTGIR